MVSGLCHLSKPFAMADQVNGMEKCLHPFYVPPPPPKKSAPKDLQALISAGKHSCMSL